VTDEAAVVTETKPETDAKVLKRIRRREQRSERGPWKWQLIDLLQKNLEATLHLTKVIENMGAQSETQRKLSEAGKKSAAARKAKFGTAKPTANPTQVVIPAGAVLPENTDLLGGKLEPLHEPVRKKKQPSEGSAVWDAYEIAYRNRHKVEPIRNAKVNGQCKSLVTQVGAREAVELVRYYVDRNDAFYVNAKHPLGLLLLELQKLRTEYATGQSMTMRDARRQEVHASTDQALRDYAATQGAE